MNSSVTPQPQLRILPRPHIGALTVDQVSFILLGLGGLLPIVFLVTVALVLRCYRKHKEAQNVTWKAHLGGDRLQIPNGGRKNERRSRKTYEDLEKLSFSLQESDVNLDPYFVAGEKNSTDLDEPIEHRYDRRKSELNTNVYYRYSKEEDGRRSRDTEADSAIAESEATSSLADHNNSSASSSAEYSTVYVHTDALTAATAHPGAALTTVTSGAGEPFAYPPGADTNRAKRKAPGHPPGVIMGVNYLIENAKNSAERTRTRSGSGYLSAQEAQLVVTSSAQNQPIYATPYRPPAKDSNKTKNPPESSLKRDEEQVLRYFDNTLSMEMDSSPVHGQTVTSSSFRRNSDFHLTRL